jgi:putative DNA primase/helicase
MMLGPCRGGAVRLVHAGEVTLIGEGIETCRTLELPEDVRGITVLADGDLAGEAAAQAAALRWTRQSRRVRIAQAPAGMDFNDLL